MQLARSSFGCVPTRALPGHPWTSKQGLAQVPQAPPFVCPVLRLVVTVMHTPRYMACTPSAVQYAAPPLSACPWVTGQLL